MLSVAALVLASSMVVGQAEGKDPHQQWIKYFAGSWAVTDQNGNTYDEPIGLASGGTALFGQGKLPDGVDYVRVLGWEADSKTLVETWYLSNGMHLVTRFREIGENKLVGNVTLADGKGQTAKGTVTREKTSKDEFTSTYRGNLPGQGDESILVWKAKRK